MTNQDNQQQIKPVIISLLFLLSLAPWLVFQLDRFMPADAAFLTLAARDFLAGKSMTEAYFDNNPPMSYLIFIPSVLISRLGFELWQAHNIYVFSLIAVGAALSRYILKRTDEFYRPFIFMILCAYIYSVTVPMSLGFGQKDHLIVIALFPLICAQYILLRIEQNREADCLKTTTLIVFTFILFTPFILLKPHYGIIPTAMIAYRCFNLRSFRSIFRADFWVLACGVIGYALIIWKFFPDFINIVLPLTMKLYITDKNPISNHSLTIAALIFPLCLGVFTLCIRNITIEEKRVTVLFCSATALAIIPYSVQGKGFSLHFLPFMSLLILSTTVVIYLFIRDQRQRYRATFLIIALILCLISGVAIKPNVTETHNYFKNHPVIKDIGIEHNHQSFFIENNTTSVVFPISIYNHMRHASRFSVVWLISVGLNNLRKDELDEVLNLMANSIYEDVEHYKPETMLLLDDKKHPGYLYLLKNNSKMKTVLSQYNEPQPYQTNSLRYSDEENLPIYHYKLYKRK